jgi:hypothetical protein
MYVARETSDPHCDVGDMAAAPLAAGELRLFMPQAAAGAPFIVPQGQEYCRRLGVYAVCSLNTTILAGLPAQDTFPLFPIGRTIRMAEPTLPPVAVGGWYAPEPDSTWTLGHLALLAGQFDIAATTPMRLTVWGWGLTDSRNGIQKVTVRVDDTAVAHWDVRDGDDRSYSASIPPDLLGAGPHVIRLEIAHPVRPTDMKIAEDTRQLGFCVKAFRLDSEVDLK